MRILLAAALAMIASPAALADANTPASAADVIALCETAGGPGCTKAVEAFLDARDGLEDALPELVIGLVELTQDGLCDELDAAVAEAIHRAAEYSGDAGQSAQLIEIADAVGECEGLDLDGMAERWTLVGSSAPFASRS